MKTQEASNSAAIIAAHRAFDSAKPAAERICYDPYAEQFAGPGFTVIGEVDVPADTALELFNALVPGFHEFFLARTKYIDDMLEQHLANGLEQLVILGAGYDSRAYRFKALVQQARVFEVDHPATQRVKKERVRSALRALPIHVTYVPADFQEEALADCLPANGYDPSLKTFFIWEGVTMYIDAAAVDTVLAFIAENSGSGSSVIFDFTSPDVIAGTCERPEAGAWLNRAQEKGEPLLFGIATNVLDKFLSAKGFDEIVCVGSEFFNRTYFTGIHQNREATPILSIVHATVSAR
jgi:methyltransferase (TIGR00027 family)